MKVRSTMSNWFLSVKWIATGGLITEGETEAHRGNVAFSGSRVTAAARFPSRLRRLFRRLSLRAAFTIFPGHPPRPAQCLAQTGPDECAWVEGMTGCLCGGVGVGVCVCCERWGLTSWRQRTGPQPPPLRGPRRPSRPASPPPGSPRPPASGLPASLFPFQARTMSRVSGGKA